MKGWTPIQTLAKLHRELWWTIRLVGSLEAQFDGESASWKDCVEIQKVLRQTVIQVEWIIRREKDAVPNPRDRRPGAELALKAQLAKARDAVASVVVAGPSWRSHK